MTTFSVIVPVRGRDDRSDVQLTLRSLAAARGAPQVIVVEPGDELAGWQRALDRATGDWTGLAVPGTAWDVDAFDQMAGAVAGSEGAVVAYGSERAPLGPGGEPEMVLKPPWSPRLLLAGNYFASPIFFRTGPAGDAGGFVGDDVATEGYDMALRMSERGEVAVVATTILTRVTGQWPPTSQVAARAPALRCVGRALRRRGEWDFSLRAGERWQLLSRRDIRPAVEVIIPTRDRSDLLKRCLASLALTHYPRFDITIVDNGSTEVEALRLQKGRHVLHHRGSFNFSDLVNDAVYASNASYVALVNNDVEIIDPEWLDVLMDEALGDRVGAVGCRLVGADGVANHEGTAVGVDGVPAIELSLGGLDAMRPAPRDVSAVTAACMLVRVEAFRHVGGFDPIFAVGYGDVDFCLRLRRAGYATIYTPATTARHLRRATRGDAGHPDDDRLFQQRWGQDGPGSVDRFINPLILQYEPPVLAESLRHRLQSTDGQQARSNAGQAVQSVSHLDHGESLGG